MFVNAAKILITPPKWLGLGLGLVFVPTFLEYGCELTSVYTTIGYYFHLFKMHYFFSLQMKWCQLKNLSESLNTVNKELCT